MANLSRWAWNNLLALDQAVNAIFGGDPDETISSRAGKSAKKGSRWACVLCKVLHWFEDDHCNKSIEADRGGAAIDR